jgi:dTDP-4-amino-4,6-dideoxygalactose transaminase
MKLFETKISSYDTNVKISPIIQSGELGFGPNVPKFEEEFASYSNKEHNVALNSCSSAGFIIFAYLKEKYGKCDVYTPSIGFTSMTWAAKHHGHNLIFVDVDSSMLMNVKSYKNARRWRCERYSDRGIKPVIMPILYGGVSTIPNFIENIEEDGYNEFIVLDSAHCSTPTMKSDVSLFSFHPYKPIAASDGGMLSTDFEEIAEYTRSYRNFGRENTKDGYVIANEGFKCYMNNLNATISLTQLNAYQNNLNIRKEVWDKLNSMGLDGTLAEHDRSSSYYVGTLIAKSEDIAKEYREKYCSARLYPPLHQQPYYKECERGSLFDTEKFYRLLVNLPLYNPKAYE